MKKQKKCRHDKCKRKALGNGYCSECIHLPAKICNYCSEWDKKGRKETRRKKSVLGKMGETTQWILVIGFVLGFMAVMVMGVWYAFNWLMESTLGINLLELCARVGLEGQLLMFLVAFVLISIIVMFLRGCIDPC